MAICGFFFGSGLSRYDRKTATFTNFNVKMVCCNVYDIIEETKDSWLTSNIRAYKI